MKHRRAVGSTAKSSVNETVAASCAVAPGDSVSRSFSLAQDVDQAAAAAKYNDGVLELTLPKKPGGRASQLTVS